MLRKTTVAAMIVLASGAAQAALGPGTLAFTSFNADEDGFSLVTFADIAANTTIYFQDNEWNGQAVGAGGAFNTGEGLHTWSTGASPIAAGTVVRFAAVDQASRSASIGTLASSGDTGLNATAETIYAYLGATVSEPTTFLAAVSTGGFGSNGTLDNTGLQTGVSAVSLTASTDYAQYVGMRSGEASFAGYLQKVNDASNWTMIVGGDQAAMMPDTTAFTITPVPEPETYALMLAGLGLVGWAARRRANGR